MRFKFEEKKGSFLLSSQKALHQMVKRTKNLTQTCLVKALLTYYPVKPLNHPKTLRLHAITGFVNILQYVCWV